MQRVYDVAVHLGEFRNLDLAAKGLYLFRVSIKTTDDIAGKPYAFSSEPRTRASFTRSGDEIPALADDGELPGAACVGDAFQTRAVAIRYEDERYDVAETAQFRVARASDAPPQFDVRVALAMAPLPAHESADTPVERFAAAPPEFAVVASATLRLAARHGACPVVFPGHPCRVDVSAHVALLASRFRRPRGGAPGPATLRALLWGADARLAASAARAARRGHLRPLAASLAAIEAASRDFAGARARPEPQSSSSDDDDECEPSSSDDDDDDECDADAVAALLERDARALEGEIFVAWNRFVDAARASRSPVAGALLRRRDDEAAAAAAARVDATDARVQQLLRPLDAAALESQRVPYRPGEPARA